MPVTMNQEWADGISKDLSIALAELAALRTVCRFLIVASPEAWNQLSKIASQSDELTLFQSMTEEQRERVKFTFGQLVASLPTGPAPE